MADNTDVSQLPTDAVNSPASGTYLGFVAGILEGEGCFSRSGLAGVRVAVKMTDLDVLEKLQDFTALGTINGPYTPAADNFGKKPYWTWSVNKRDDVISLVGAVYPLLGLRRQARCREILAVAHAAAETYKPTGFCRPGLHPKTAAGRCLPCRQAGIVRAVARRRESARG